MKTGTCHLCNQWRELQKSHVWPKFAYKRYVSEQKTGGSFTNLQELRRNNRHETFYWFCSECELRIGKYETYASKLLKKIEDDPDKNHEYNSSLLPFAVSLSLRVAKYYMPRSRYQWARVLLRSPCKTWKEFLLERKQFVKPYSQHAFVDYGEPVPGYGENVFWHNMLGGQVFHDEKFIFSRIGPLLIGGLLDRKNLPSHDRNIWELSEIKTVSGTVYPISRDQPEIILTDDLVHALNNSDVWCLNRRKKVS